jgi:hypothetical protein
LQGKIWISMFVAATVLCANAAVAQGKIADLRARFVREPSPVNKAKLMPQLGDAEFAEVDADVAQGKLPEALAVLKLYREEIDSCDQALTGMGVDAEKHPAGFKQLQFSLRDSLRRLDTVIVNMTSDEQAPFLSIRADLSEINVHLIQHLFPHESPAKPAPPN